MTKIIPGVLAKTKKQLIDAARKLRFAKKIHLDIMDGKFVQNKTVHSIGRLFPNAKLQLHVMAYNPEKYLKKFPNASECIVHVEACDALKVIKKIRKAKMKPGIAFNPSTKIQKNREAITKASIALVMTVEPGFSGQKMMKAPLSKIKTIRKINKHIIVGIDGGVNEKTCKYACNANFAISTSAILKADSPNKMNKYLERICKKTKK